MTVYLLDINLLLALADPNHTHHSRAHDWFGREDGRAWATCPGTENGFVRIASHPKYPNRPGDASTVLEQLRQMCRGPGHRFWADSVSLRSGLGSEAAFTHHAVTDLYLLTLAVENQAKLATFDRKIPAAIVAGGAEAIELLT